MIEDSVLKSTQESVPLSWKWIVFRSSIRPNGTISYLGANMKKYTTCEDCIDHSCHPSRLREFLFEVVNGLLTVARAIGNVAGNPISLQLKTTEEVKGSSSTHRKDCGNDDIHAQED